MLLSELHPEATQARFVDTGLLAEELDSPCTRPSFMLLEAEPHHGHGCACCKDALVEPVVLLCGHAVCLPCVPTTLVDKAPSTDEGTKYPSVENMCCPLCRMVVHVVPKPCLVLCTSAKFFAGPAVTEKTQQLCGAPRPKTGPLVVPPAAVPEGYNLYQGLTFDRPNGPDKVNISADEYVWYHVPCEGCGMFPIKGRKFGCSGCLAHSLCQECYFRGISKTRFQQLDHSFEHEFEEDRQILTDMHMLQALHTDMSAPQIISLLQFIQMQNAPNFEVAVAYHDGIVEAIKVDLEMEELLPALRDHVERSSDGKELILGFDCEQADIEIVMGLLRDVAMADGTLANPRMLRSLPEDEQQATAAVGTETQIESVAVGVGTDDFVDFLDDPENAHTQLTTQQTQTTTTEAELAAQHAAQLQEALQFERELEEQRTHLESEVRRRLSRAYASRRGTVMWSLA